MALTTSNGGANFLAGPVVYPASVKGIWTTIHSDLSATASSGANLVTPFNQSDTKMIWVKVPDNATRCHLRAKALVAMTGSGTSPIVNVWGMTTSQTIGSDGALPSDASPRRLDVIRPAAANAAGLTLSLTAAGSHVNAKDATYIYSQETADIDCGGVAYISVLVSQAYATFTGGGTPVAEIEFVN